MAIVISPQVVSITGTANQVVASASNGAVTLSLPQSIGTGSSVTFAGVTDSALTSGRVVLVGTAGVLRDDGNLTWDGSVFAASNTASFTPQFVFQSNANDTTAAYFNFQKSRSSGNVSNGDTVGNLVFQAFHTTYQSVGLLNMSIVGVPSSSVIPTQMAFVITNAVNEDTVMTFAPTALTVPVNMVASAGLTLANATDITINATTGTKIGQSGSKIGFYGVTPAVRPTTLTQTYSTTNATHAAVTQLAAPAGGTGVAAGGWSTSGNRDLAITSINAARTDIANLKDFVNQVVDQLQAIGLLQ